MNPPPTEIFLLTRSHLRMWTILGAILVAVFGAIVVVMRGPDGALDRMSVLTLLAVAGTWVSGVFALRSRVRSEPGDRSWPRTSGVCLLMVGGAAAMVLLLT